MKNYILFLCALLTIGFASSCKQPTDYDTDRWSDKDTTAKPAQAELAGEWFLEAYEQSGSPMQYITNGQTYSLNFKDSKNISGNANCNKFTGTYQADSLVTMTAKVSFKNIVATKLNCGPADLGSKYLSILGSSVKLTVQYYSSGQRLEISYFDAVTGNMYSMFFNRKQTPNYNYDLLKGTDWTLVSFEKFGQPAEWIPLAQQENLNISFLGDSMAVGTAECGKFSAEYSTYDKPLPGTVDYLLGIYITNSVPCNGNYGSRFLDALAGAKKYYRYGDSLEITYSADNGITVSRMMFVRRNTSNSGVIITDSTVVVGEMPDTMNVANTPFTIIQNGVIADDALKLGVQFLGGCGLHEFVIYGKVTQGGVEMLLTHNSTDACKSIVQKDVTLNLAWYVSEYKRITGKSTGQMKFVMRSTGGSGFYSYGYNF